MHWGVFGPDDDAETVEGHLAATERLNATVCAAAAVGDGSVVLDVGCGFGGTLRHLAAQLRDSTLVGLNVDSRQLRFGRSHLRPGRGNRVHLIHGNGSSMGLRSQTFDSILAIESLFHLDSRARFFREAARLLTDDGRLVITDFVVEGPRLAEWAAVGRPAQHALRQFFGYAPSGHVSLRRYERHARAVGLKLVSHEDLTAGIIPSFVGLGRLYELVSGPSAPTAIGVLEQLSRQRLLTYQLLTVTR
jgi:cyclopropane fatty-acyl-phospholipid synthase-like methyltransferase